jgi:plastocyanin
MSPMRAAALAAATALGLSVCPGGAAAEPERTVRMTGVPSYSPDQVIVQVGQAVRWVNVSDVEHTVTADPTAAPGRAFVHVPPGAEAFDSGPIAPGGTFRRTFRTPGTFVYFSRPHVDAEVIGTVTVEAGDAGRAPAPAPADGDGAGGATDEAS